MEQRFSIPRKLRLVLNCGYQLLSVRDQGDRIFDAVDPELDTFLSRCDERLQRFRGALLQLVLDPSEGPPDSKRDSCGGDYGEDNNQKIRPWLRARHRPNFLVCKMVLSLFRT